MIDLLAQLEPRAQAVSSKLDLSALVFCISYSLVSSLHPLLSPVVSALHPGDTQLTLEQQGFELQGVHL